VCLVLWRNLRKVQDLVAGRRSQGAGSSIWNEVVCFGIASRLAYATRLEDTSEGGSVSRSRYLPRTTSIPANTSSVLAWDNLPVRSVRRLLSMLTMSAAIATESLARPVRVEERKVLPGAVSHLRLVVSGTHTVVAIRLRLSESLCTMTTGLRNPGPDPAGAGRSAHQISPCDTTTLRALEFAWQLCWRMCHWAAPIRRRVGSFFPSPHPERAGRRTPEARLRTTGYGIFWSGELDFR